MMDVTAVNFMHVRMLKNVNKTKQKMKIAFLTFESYEYVKKMNI